MKKIFLAIVLFTVIGVAMLLGGVLVTKASEPAIMWLFGTGLISAAGIIKK